MHSIPYLIQYMHTVCTSYDIIQLRRYGGPFPVNPIQKNELHAKNIISKNGADDVICICKYAYYMYSVVYKYSVAPSRRLPMDDGRFSYGIDFKPIMNEHVYNKRLDGPQGSTKYFSIAVYNFSFRQILWWWDIFFRTCGAHSWGAAHLIWVITTQGHAVTARMFRHAGQVVAGKLSAWALRVF